VFSTYRKEGDKIVCQICPSECLIGEGKKGRCQARGNKGNEGILYTYGKISSEGLDPIEKKPLYHFFPGSRIFSVGSWGCNMSCNFCQNHTISQSINLSEGRSLSPGQLIEEAARISGNIGIAFTYNEPLIWYEFVRDVSLLAQNRGLKTVLVTNGYANKATTEEFIKFTDAFNVDLKAFTENFYLKETGASVGPVKSNLKIIAGSGRHLEITTLIIPGLNDNKKEFTEQVKWISGELGPSVPLHVSRYFPRYRQKAPPTDPSLIEELCSVAADYLDFVYTGNYDSINGSNTYCTKCHSCITTRMGYSVVNHCDANGACTNCGEKIYKWFTSS
jgi:pyruvate formate lyase activating enzyme